jgi:hypothetical protein
MKPSIYKTRVILITRITMMIFAFQVNFLFASIMIESGPAKNLTICVNCASSSTASRKEEISDELISLAPTVPAEATFPDESAYAEINLEPTTPESASFDDDPGAISEDVFEYLAPVTPAEADFNDYPVSL